MKTTFASLLVYNPRKMQQISSFILQMWIYQYFLTALCLQPFDKILICLIEIIPLSSHKRHWCFSHTSLKSVTTAPARFCQPLTPCCFFSHNKALFCCRDFVCEVVKRQGFFCFCFICIVFCFVLFFKYLFKKSFWIINIARLSHLGLK